MRITPLCDTNSFSWTVHSTSGNTYLVLPHADHVPYKVGVVAAVATEQGGSIPLQCWVPAGLMFPHGVKHQHVSVRDAFSGICAAVGASVPQQKRQLDVFTGRSQQCVPVLITLPAAMFSSSVLPKTLSQAICKRGGMAQQPALCVAAALKWGELKDPSKRLPRCANLALLTLCFQRQTCLCNFTYKHVDNRHMLFIVCTTTSCY